MLSLCLNHRILEQVKYAPPGIRPPGYSTCVSIVESWNKSSMPHQVRPPGYSTCVSIIESWNKSSMPHQESVHRDIVLVSQS